MITVKPTGSFLTKPKRFDRFMVATGVQLRTLWAAAGLSRAGLKRTIALPVFAAMMISLAATVLIAFYLPESKRCTLSQSPECANVRKVFGQEHKDCIRLQKKKGASMAQVLKRPSWNVSSLRKTTTKTS